MKNWKKVILGVALSFMILFTALGYAALTDQLSISGSLNAQAPEDIYITNIDGEAEITGLTSMSTTISGSSGSYTVTVKNNHPSVTYVYTGANVTGANADVTAWYAGKENDEYGIPKDTSFTFSDTKSDDGAYISGIPIAPGDELPFNVKLTPNGNTNPTSVEVKFIFEEVKYYIHYINNSETLDIRCVLNNSAAVDTENNTAASEAERQMDDTTVEFGYWMNSGGSKVANVPANNKEDYVLYPKFNAPFTAMFVNQDGSLLGWCFFNNNETSKYYYKNADTVARAMENADSAAQLILDDLEYEYEIDYWIVHGIKMVNGVATEVTEEWKPVNPVDKEYEFDNFEYYNDVTIYPHYKYKGANLNPVDDGNDGDVDYYEVVGYPENSSGTTLVVIPSDVNGAPVTTVNPNAFSSFDDLHSVVIPETITEIGANAFSAISGFSRDTITMYFEGNPDLWHRYMDLFYKDRAYSYYTDYNSTTDKYAEITQSVLTNSWDSGMGEGSRVFFLDANGKVNQNAGYWELENLGWRKNGDGWLDYGEVYAWIFHGHPYDNTLESYSNCANADTHYSTFTDYAGACDCISCNGADRPDAGYWEGVTTTSTFGVRETTPEEETTTPEEETTTPEEETTTPKEETTTPEEETTTPEEETTTPEEETTTPEEETTTPEEETTS